LTAATNSANKRASSDRQALDSKTKQFKSLLDEKDQADEDCRSAINQTRTINKEFEEVKRKHETLKEEAANAVDTISDLTNDKKEIQSKLDQLERSAARETAEAESNVKSMEERIKNLEVALDEKEKAAALAQASMNAMANAEGGAAQALLRENEGLRSKFANLESNVKAQATKIELLQVSVFHLCSSALLLTLDQSDSEKTKKAHEEINNTLTELRYNYSAYQGNTEVKEQELISKNDALVKENNHLVAGITLVLQSSGQQLMNLDEMNEDIMATLSKLVQNSSKDMLTEIADGTTTSTVAPMAEVIADDFNVVFLEKNVQTLTSLVVQTLRNTGSVDDLAHIQQNYTRYAQRAQEPTWVLSTIACFLDKEIEIAGDDRDGIRFCMALSLVSQLDEMLYNRNLPTLGWDLVDFRSYVASFVDKGFLAFVMAARYLKSRQMHDILYDTPALQQTTYEDNETPRSLIEWCALVKVDCTLLQALGDEDLWFLSFGMKTWIQTFEEPSSGRKMTVVWDRAELSWFQDVLIVFLQEADGTSHTTTFRPHLTIKVKPMSRLQTIHFGRSGPGIDVKFETALDIWMRKFYETEFLEAEAGAEAIEDVILGLSTVEDIKIKREPEADDLMQLG